ncbi:HAD-IA family hydrolase [Hydrogenoanaerobacterium sp.]|uniref:HAD-IA family hydrolase n=1 Tax=Hydrogenoanaerobacterium sp. TaxID=2953763 RepID=UPI00289D0212|nr:HAD-IA family hydrolase [Hydrogenoanaerobacterium sp.]
MGNWEYILFDFDGTIVNSEEGITKGVAYSLKQIGIEVTNLSELRAFIGPSLRYSYREFFGLNEEQIAKVIATYHEYNHEKGMLECFPYKGAVELLQHLKDAGKKVILATSKPQYFAEKILERFDLLRFFDFISGSGLDGSRTDKAEVIAHALEQCRITDLEKALMIGDRKYDVMGAKATGLRCVGVLYGFGDRAEFEESGADYIVSDVAELEKLLLGAEEENFRL